VAKILIVDDSDANLKLMGYELEKAGYEVASARSGREALARARSSRPDAVLLDVLMPEMDGFETCRRLKADPDLASVPVLMWTSLNSTDDVVRGLEVGAQDYVTKPFVSEVLRARIRSVLRAKKDRDALIDANLRLEESQRAAQQALNVRNEFLSHESHELRTPLSSLHQFLTIVLDGLAGKVNSEQQEYLEICLRNAKQLRSMISDLMDVTRLQNGKLRITPRPLIPTRVVDDVVRSQENIAHEKGITLLASTDGVPEVLGDEVRIRQVLINLLDNAIKYTSEGGTVEVRAERDPANPDLARISVIDTGCGVSAEGRDRIFRYMQQEGDHDWRSRKGLGIGLYICKELVTRQGGRLWVDSDGRSGSRFCFTLPEFDFAKIIQRAVVEHGRVRPAFGLIRVDIAPADPNSSRGIPETLSRRAYHLAKTSLFPGDVLLPRFFHTGVHDTYFGVIACDEGGMKSVCARIRGKLGENTGLDEDLVKVSVRGILRRPSPETLARPDALAAVAQEIEELTQIDSNWSE
jgi:signal transduction histidine kinase